MPPAANSVSLERERFLPLRSSNVSAVRNGDGAILEDGEVAEHILF